MFIVRSVEMFYFLIIFAQQIDYKYCRPNLEVCCTRILVVAWSGNALVSINVVILRRARLVLRWVTFTS